MEFAKDGAGRDSKGRVLVIPTRTDAEGAQDSATFDVLLAAALQEIGFDVVELGQVTDGLRREVPSLERARELYLDLKLEEALEQATGVRDAHTSNHGDLVDWEEIAEVISTSTPLGSSNFINASIVFGVEL